MPPIHQKILNLRKVFIPGKLAGRDGLIHGFMVWATTMIFTVILGVFLAISAVKFTTNVLGSIASLTGDVVSGVGSAVGGGVSVLSDKAQDIFGDIDITSDEDKKDVEKNVRDALRKSGVKELQPRIERSFAINHEEIATNK